MHIDELMDPALRARMLAEKFIRSQVHPTLPLTVLNYTEQAQYRREWNEVTRQCRGLIIDGDGLVVARPFPKFFNHGEPDAPHLEEGPIRVLDKADGSLGILYATDEQATEWAISTRGSFTSDQAKWATNHLHATYPTFSPTVGATYLYEIVYPQNRIVVDYEGWEGLILLDILDNESGDLRLLYDTWPGPKVEQFDYPTVMDVLAAEPRPNREGFVIHHLNTGHRVKVKYDDYVRLHRIVTGTTARTVWEHLANDLPWGDLVEHVPDEFYDWVESTAEDLRQDFMGVFNQITVDWLGVLNATGDIDDPREYRKTFAGHAARATHRAALFLKLDGKDDQIRKYAWQQVRPEAARPFTNTVEAP